MLSILHVLRLHSSPMGYILRFQLASGHPTSEPGNQTEEEACPAVFSYSPFKVKGRWIYFFKYKNLKGNDQQNFSAPLGKFHYLRVSPIR